MNAPTYPGAVEPERTRSIVSLGLRINLAEWGDPAAPPALLCHGGWDHARSFALLAPLLARRLRVIAMDIRGHGDSEWASFYPWMTSVIDIVNVLRSLGRPAVLIGHSMGGGQAADAAKISPELIRVLGSIDG